MHALYDDYPRSSIMMHLFHPPPPSIMSDDVSAQQPAILCLPALLLALRAAVASHRSHRCSAGGGVQPPISAHQPRCQCRSGVACCALVREQEEARLQYPHHCWSRQTAPRASAKPLATSHHVVELRTVVLRATHCLLPSRRPTHSYSS